jgi:hypothetical protein
MVISQRVKGDLRISWNIVRGTKNVLHMYSVFEVVFGERFYGQTLIRCVDTNLDLGRRRSCHKQF